MEIQNFVRQIRENYGLAGMEFVDACDMVLLYLERNGIFTQEKDVFPTGAMRKLANENGRLRKVIMDQQDVINTLTTGDSYSEL